MTPALYQGQVIHDRKQPKRHFFRYRVFLFFFNVEKPLHMGLGSLIAGTKLWSLFRFKREDYHRNKSLSLKQSVTETVFQKTGWKCDGDVFILTQLRLFGFVFNPVSFYYCYDKSGSLRAILSEIENTPWKERYCYAFLKSENDKYEFKKEFHVSPFMPMDQDYKWTFVPPSQEAQIGMETWSGRQLCFYAGFKLIRKELKPLKLLSLPLTHPFQTWKVPFGIYWQAFCLYVKRIPFYGHPNPDSQITLRKS